MSHLLIIEVILGMNETKGLKETRGVNEDKGWMKQDGWMTLFSQIFIIFQNFEKSNFSGRQNEKTLFLKIWY